MNRWLLLLVSVAIAICVPGCKNKLSGTVSVNGKSVDSGSWDDLVDEAEPGDVIRIGMFRRGAFREVELTIAGMVPERYEIDYLDEPTDEQKASYETWTGQSWPGE